MAKITLQEALQKVKEAKLKEKQLREERKAQQKVLAVEYTDNLSADEKQKQIAEAEKILNTANANAETIKQQYKTAMKKVKNDVVLAREILSFVNYKQTHSLPHQKNSFVVNGKILTFKRDGIKDITIDISKGNWQQVMKQELAKQGINGDNRVADNIVYKASQLVKSNITV